MQVLFLPQESGQGLVEYALLIVLIAVVVLIAIRLLGPLLGNLFSNIGALFSDL